MIYDSSTDEFSSPFEQATTVNLEHCQYYCSDVFKGYCTFFSYKVKTSFNSNCNLYDFDPIDFASTCQRVGGSKNDDPMQCIHPSNKCSVSTISKRTPSKKNPEGKKIPDFCAQKSQTRGLVWVTRGPIETIFVKTIFKIRVKKFCPSLPAT